MRHRLAPLLFLVVALQPALASAGESEDSFARATEALTKNNARRGLLELEALADKGYVHPDVSFNRGIAYVMRARSNAAQPGDLGRAAAAFEEASKLLPDDLEARRALELVRAQVARKRSRQDKNDTIVRPTLDRVVPRQFSSASWGIAAIVSSVLMSIGLLLRARPAGVLHVAGSVLAPIALIGLLVLAPVAYFAKHLEETTRPGVVVVTEAALQDENGSNTVAPVIPEATLVELSDRRGETIFVRWGAYEGWLPYDTVRPLGLK